MAGAPRSGGAAFARGRWRCSEGAEPLVLARAWLRQARANHGPICVPAGRARERAHGARALDRSERTAGDAAERSEALAAWAWAEAVAGSVEEAERLLIELSAEPDSNGDLRVYDVGHARALALMRRGRFVESYGPSIAAGEAIRRAGHPDLAYGCWANAASAACAAGEHERALEFLDRGMAALAGYGLRASRFICWPSGRSCFAGSSGSRRPAPRPSRSRRWPTGSGGRS